MERSLRDDWATEADVADLRTELHDQLRAQTWRLSALVVATGGLMFGIARLA